MASLAEHLSAHPAKTAPTAPLPTRDIAPVELFCMSVTLFAFSCSVLAYWRLMSARR